MLEHERGAVHALVTQWLSEERPLSSRSMLLGTVEAMKTVVSLGLGNVDRAGRRGCGPDPNIVVRPLQREIPCPLGLMERINKQNNPALDIVRGALLELRAGI